MEMANTTVINLDELPAMIPPPGVTSNFVTPYSEGRDIYITVAVCIGLITPALLIRLFTKAYLIKRINLEDCELKMLLHHEHY